MFLFSRGSMEMFGAKILFNNIKRKKHLKIALSFVFIGVSSFFNYNRGGYIL